MSPYKSHKRQIRFASFGSMLILIMAMSLICGMSYAQTPPTIIVNTGVATVKDAPGIVEITVEHIFQDQDLVVATAQADNFEGRLREALTNNKLYPTKVEAIPPYVRTLSAGDVVAAVRLQFVLPRLGSTVERVTQVTQLQRSLGTLAETMQFQYSEPVWLVEEPERLEKDAVARATENAYHLAEAAAGTLNNGIDHVDSVEIIGTEWNTVPGHPNMNEVTCTARVKVVYTLAPTN